MPGGRMAAGHLFCCVCLVVVVAAAVVFVGVLMYFDAWACGTDVGVGVGMHVDAAVVVGAAPGLVVDHDGVSAPAEACAVPAEDAEGRADGDDGAEANGSADDEAWAWGVEDDCGVVDGNVVVGGVDGLDLDVAAVIDDVVVGVGREVAVG